MDDINNKLQPKSGTYALIFEIEQAQALRVGRLGMLSVEPGFYIYVGSAFGSGGVRARLRHHMRPSLRPHWHIDYLKNVATLREMWVTYAEVKQECVWAEVWGENAGISTPFPRFGASDCRCPAHLFYTKTDEFPEKMFATRIKKYIIHPSDKNNNKE